MSRRSRDQDAEVEEYESDAEVQEVASSPNRFFLTWSLKALLKALVIGMVLGLIWSITNQVPWSPDLDQAGNRWSLMLTFVLDATMTFWITVIGTYLGLSMHTWDVLGVLLSSARRYLVTRYLWSVLLVVAAMAAVRYYQPTYSYGLHLGISGVAYVITATMAFSVAFHTYCLFGVLNRTDRAKYLTKRSNRSSLIRIGGSLGSLDRNHVKLPILWVSLIVLPCLGAMIVITNQWPGLARAGQALYAVLIILGFTLWGLLRRMVDQYLLKSPRLYTVWDRHEYVPERVSDE